MEPTLSQGQFPWNGGTVNNKIKQGVGQIPVDGLEEVPGRTNHRTLYSHVDAENRPGRAREACPALEPGQGLSHRLSKISSGLCSIGREFLFNH